VKWAARINPHASGSGLRTNIEGNTIQMVEFDVAVQATEGDSTKRGVGVMVAAIGLGAQQQSDEGRSTTSRVKFSVPVVLP